MNEEDKQIHSSETGQAISKQKGMEVKLKIQRFGMIKNKKYFSICSSNIVYLLFLRPYELHRYHTKLNMTSRWMIILPNNILPILGPYRRISTYKSRRCCRNRVSTIR